jgi:hypothetical protein
VCVCVCVCVRERERERERERDVGCDEDKCIGEISGLDLMFYIFFFSEKERRRRPCTSSVCSQHGVWSKWA